MLLNRVQSVFVTHSWVWHRTLNKIHVKMTITWTWWRQAWVVSLYLTKEAYSLWCDLLQYIFVLVSLLRPGFFDIFVSWILWQCVSFTKILNPLQYWLFYKLSLCVPCYKIIIGVNGLSVIVLCGSVHVTWTSMLYALTDHTKSITSSFTAMIKFWTSWAHLLWLH